MMKYPHYYYGMSKPIYKSFCLILLVLLAGCQTALTGNLTKEAPHEKTEQPMVYFCPKSNCSSVLENSITSANKSVHCAIYDLNLKNIISALSEKRVGVDVRVVMDGDNFKGQLERKGVELDDNIQLMHNKFCVIDDSLVLTGSFNPTENDNTKNNNNLVVLHSDYLAKNYENEFLELWKGNFAGRSKSLNPVVYMNDLKIENYFCPADCGFEFAGLIRNAQNSIEVAAFTFTSEKVADELIKAQSRGVNVTILIEKRQRNVINSQYERLKGFGMQVKLDGNKYNMHHKFIIIDGKIVLTGSPNFTFSGFHKNAENVLIIHDEGIASKYNDEFNSVFDLGTA